MTETTDADELAEMQRQYRYATPASHILVDGALYLRCQKCRHRPVPHGAFITLCDPCLDEATGKAGADPMAIRRYGCCEHCEHDINDAPHDIPCPEGRTDDDE